MTEQRSVTIEGTITPAAGVLAYRERKTVAYTERIGRLATLGFIRIVEFHNEAPQAEPVEEVNDQGGAQLTVERQIEVPRRNASRAEWAAWLDENEIAYPPESGRDDLVIIWEESGRGEDIGNDS